jgi:hypothetical protein
LNSNQPISKLFHGNQLSNFPGKYRKTRQNC